MLTFEQIMQWCVTNRARIEVRHIGGDGIVDAWKTEIEVLGHRFIHTTGQPELLEVANEAREYAEGMRRMAGLPPVRMAPESTEHPLTKAELIEILRDGIAGIRW